MALASSVQIETAAVSYPGVGRFRRAETGILGRAIRGSYRAPYFFARCAFDMAQRPGASKRGASFLAGHLDLIKPAENLFCAWELMLGDDPLGKKLAITVGDKNALPDEAA
jgi:hypothetical protein